MIISSISDKSFDTRHRSSVPKRNAFSPLFFKFLNRTDSNAGAARHAATAPAPSCKRRTFCNNLLRQPVSQLTFRTTMPLASLAAASRSCLHLDGKGHGSCGNPAHLQITGTGSMAACVRITQDTIKGSQDFANILAHGHDGVSEVFLRLNTQNLRVEAGSWQVRGMRLDARNRIFLPIDLHSL